MRSVRAKRVLVLLAFTSLGLVLLATFLNYIGFQQIANLIMNIPPRMLILLFLLDMIGLFLYGLSWHLLIRSTGGRISLGSSQAINLSAIFLYYATPSGFFIEATRAFLASRESGIKLGRASATVVLHRILFVLVFGILCLLSIAIIGVGYRMPSSMLLVSILAIIAASVALALAFPYLLNLATLRIMVTRAIHALRKPLSKVADAFQLEDLEDSISKFTDEFNQGFKAMIQNRFSFLAAFSLMILYSLSSISIMYAAFRSLRYEISIWVVALTIGVGDFIQMTPIIIPGMIGVIEPILTGILAAFGVPVTVAASATMLARLATFWFDLPVTGVAAVYYSSKYATREILRALYE